MAVRPFRKRYISFTVDGNLSRKEMIRHLNRMGKEIGAKITLTVFEGDRGIVLVEHIHKDAAIDAMNSYPLLKIRTIRTSGTIKKAKRSLEGIS